MITLGKSQGQPTFLWEPVTLSYPEHLAFSPLELTTVVGRGYLSLSWASFVKVNSNFPLLSRDCVFARGNPDGVIKMSPFDRGNNVLNSTLINFNDGNDESALISEISLVACTARLTWPAALSSTCSLAFSWNPIMVWPKPSIKIFLWRWWSGLTCSTYCVSCCLWLEKGPKLLSLQCSSHKIPRWLDFFSAESSWVIKVDIAKKASN